MQCIRSCKTLGLRTSNKTRCNSGNKGQCCTAYIFVGKARQRDSLDIYTLITSPKLPAPRVTGRMVAEGERPLSFRHGDFDLFTTKLLSVGSHSNPEFQISLTKISSLNYVSF
jgi:hypothetical protein